MLSKEGQKLSIIISFVGLSLVVCLGILDTNPEMNFQNIYFLWSTGVILIASILTYIYSSAKPKFTLIDILVVIFTILITVNYKFVTPVNSEGKFINLMLIGFNYISLRIIFTAYKNSIPFVILIISFCGLIESIFGITQLIGLTNSNHGLYRMTGSFFNPGPFGGYLAVTMIISFAYIMRYNSWFTRYSRNFIKRPRTWMKKPVIIGYVICYVSFIASFIIFFAIMSRAAILAFAVSISVMLVFSRTISNKFIKYIKTNRTKSILLLISIGLVVCSVTYYIYNLKQDSADGRVFMWKIASRIITNKPLTGTGLGAYCGEYAKTQAEYFSSNPNSKFISIAGAPEYGFNEYLQIGVELGVFGVVLFLSILLLSTYSLFRKRHIITYGLIAMLIFSFFSYPLSLLPFQIFMVIFIACSSSLSHSKNKSNLSILITTITIFSLLYLFTSYGSIYTNKISATLQWKEMRKLYLNQNYREACVEFNSIYTQMRDNPRFLFEYGRALHMNDQFDKSTQILREGALLSSDPMFYNVIGNNFKEVGLYCEAENCYLFAYNILPDRMYSLYLLMKLYEYSEQEDKMLGTARAITSLKVKVESSATKKMIEEAKLILNK
ncbi:MAG: O-antigen ligase family protein [Rikenellaceae bacterium]